MPSIDALPHIVNVIAYGFGACLLILIAAAALALIAGAVYDVIIGNLREKHREHVHLKGTYMDFMSWRQYGKPVEIRDPKTGQPKWALTDKPEEYAEEWAMKMMLRSNGLVAERLSELERKYRAVREAELVKQE